MSRAALWPALLLFAATTGIAVAHPETESTTMAWSLRPSHQAGNVQIQLTYSSIGPTNQSTFSWSGLLARPDLEARLHQPAGAVHFTVAREPGTFDCNGTAGGESGSGQFTFAPSPQFAAALAHRGLAAPTFDQSLRLAFSDITLSFIDALPQNPRPQIAAILRAADHGVTPDYVRALAAVGYPNMSLDTLAQLRDHGVRTEMVAKLRSSGYTHLSADDLIRLVDHGVRPDFIVALQSTGYRNLSAEDLTRLVDHGVRADFVRGLSERGYRSLSADDLVKLADHGVTIGFVDRLQTHGYAHLSADELVRLRDNGL